jgi:hypothetical protein
VSPLTSTNCTFQFRLAGPFVPRDLHSQHKNLLKGVLKPENGGPRGQQAHTLAMSFTDASAPKKSRKRPRPTGSLLKPQRNLPVERDAESDGHESHDEEEALFSKLVFGQADAVLNRFGTEGTSERADQQGDGEQTKEQSAAAASTTSVDAAWADEDDEQIQVDISARARLRKLRQTEQEGAMTGAEFERRLRSRFSSSNVGQEWAQRKV